VSTAAGLAGVPTTVSASETPSVELWLADAPVARVLEQIAGGDGVRVIVDESVEGIIDGRIDGPRETVLAALVVEHGLAVHGDGSTVWFDPADRPVVDLVELSPGDAEEALATLTAPESVDEQGEIDRTADGLVLSGTREFVETTRTRIAELSSSDVPESVWDIPGYDVDYTRQEWLR